MTPPDLKSILRRSGFDLGTPQDSVRVLVELKGDEPGGDALERLTKLGLDVHRVIAKTLLGSIQRGKLQTLRDDPAMTGRGLVLTTTNKNRLDELVGSDSHAIEIVGKPYDLLQIKTAIDLALEKALL